MLARWNDDILSVFDMFDSMLPGFAGNGYQEDPIKVTSGSDGNNYFIRAVTPGFAENELHVEVNGYNISVSGKREQTSSENNIHASNRVSFEKSISLPSDAVVDNVTADYQNGILAVTIPRKVSNKIETKKVPIKALHAKNN